MDRYSAFPVCAVVGVSVDWTSGTTVGQMLIVIAGNKTSAL